MSTVTHAMALSALVLASAALAPNAAGAAQHEVSFTEYSDASSVGELAHRLTSPLQELRSAVERASAHVPANGHTLDLKAERFVVYAPPMPASGRYALLVFVPPWQDARIPSRWDGVLDRLGVIFVSAARSGNDEPAIARREPLALLAAYNLMRSYPVDPERVYVAGFSGGSRIALRLALGYPDLFRGVMLNAGSDPIGTQDVAIPPVELMRQFQRSTRVVYLTGERDVEHANEDQLSQRSLHRWCVANVTNLSEPRVGHEVADAFELSRALTELQRAPVADAGAAVKCRAALDAEIDTQLVEVDRRLAQGDRERAMELLGRVDTRFGGLAAPRSVELANRH